LDGDGDFDRLYNYGGRSVTIWDDQGNLVWDSSDQLARLTAAILPNEFNSTNDENDSFDNRSDDKGIEPEGVEVGFFRGRWYAFVGLERVGGIVVFDLTDPAAPEFVHYLSTRDFGGDAEAGTAGDLGPEGILYIPRDEERGLWPTLVVTHEVSGTVTTYRVLFKP
ncbi:MAG: alkaline phosphatase, partial [Acidobacteriota bacterium]